MSTSPDDITHHILSVLVENKAGVLARVSGLFARRGFNIISLAVAPTEDEHFSRITIAVDVASAPLDQVTEQLFKLISVVSITELDPRHAVERELLLVTVEAPPAVRPQILALVDEFVGRVLDEGEDRLTLSVEGHPDKLDGCAERLEPFGIVELQRTGRVALPKLDNVVDPRLHRV